MAIFVFWLLFRILSWCVSAKASSLRPFSDLEITMPFLPPSQPYGLWLKRVLIDPLFHWDAFHYRLISTNGYNANDSTTAFNPLFPLTGKIVSLLGIDPMVALVLVGSACGLGFLGAFMKLARLDSTNEQAQWGALFMLLMPISMVLFIPYTEGMFLLFAVLGFYFSRKKRWWLASLMGVLATLTKQTGVLMAIVIGIELWQSDKSLHRVSWPAIKSWCSVLPIPFSMIIWIISRNNYVNPIQLDWHNIQEWLLSMLISPGADMTGIRPAILWPWQLLGEVIQTWQINPLARFHIIITLGGYLLILLLFIRQWQYLRPSYRAYSLVILLFSVLLFCMYYGTLPIMSAFRHAYSAFPVFIFVHKMKFSKRQQLMIVGLGTLLFAIMMYGYSLEIWVP